MTRSRWERGASFKNWSALPLIGLSVLLLLTACGTSEPNGEDPVPPPGGEGADTPEPIDPEVTAPPTTEEFRDRIKAIRDLVDAHDYNRALDAINETLSQGPPGDLARYLEGLRAGLKRDILQSLFVDALIVLDHERVALGTPITGQVMIVNLSDKKLVIPSNAGKNDTMIELEMHYAEFDKGGTILKERRQSPVLIGKDIELGPGERFAEPIVLDSLEYGPQRVNYRTYTLEAIMYPAEIRIGDETWPGNLTFKAATCQVFPRNYEHLTDDPLGRIDQAVTKNSATHVPLAAALVKSADRKKAIDKLVGFLRRDWGEDPDSVTRVACCVGLRILTGEEIAAHPDRWIEWADNR